MCGTCLIIIFTYWVCSKMLKTTVYGRLICVWQSVKLCLRLYKKFTMHLFEVVVTNLADFVSWITCHHSCTSLPCVLDNFCLSDYNWHSLSVLSHIMAPMQSYNFFPYHSCNKYWKTLIKVGLTLNSGKTITHRIHTVDWFWHSELEFPYCNTQCWYNQVIHLLPL